MTTDPINRETIQALRHQMQRIEGAEHARTSTVATSGCEALDALLPDGGFRRGSLIEWLSNRGHGAGVLAMIAAREACREGGSLVVLDCEHKFYPPAAAALGIDLQRTVVVRPTNEQDQHWALDQALRCQAVAAVWAPIKRLTPHTFRRLQLAAETSGCLGMLLRPRKVEGQPTWSEVQMLVESRGTRVETQESSRPSTLDSRPSTLSLRLLRCRAATKGSSLNLEIDPDTGAIQEVSRRHETHSVHLASQLAHPAPRRRATGT